MAQDDLQADMAAWRRHLHAHPELGFGEHAIAGFVAARLAGFGLQVHRGLGGTGVVGTLRAGQGRAIAFRADMDALAITEVPGRPHGSQAPGVMHACGHDGHTAMLLGAAKSLVADPGFSGTVHFVFQPAEEHGQGASRMIADGLFRLFPVDEIYGLHNLPGLPVGCFATRPGPVMAAEDTFDITIRGQGVHAARPHEGVDPIVAGSAVVMALQTIVSRRLDPTAPAVVSVTEFLTDGARNVIPTTARIKGDCRSYQPAVSARIEAEMRRLASAVAEGYAAKAEVQYAREFIPTINAPEQAEAALRAARSVLGSAAVDGDCAPIMASEDFARFLAHVPGCFAFLGNGAPGTPGAVPLHNPGYDFNDAALPHGVAYFRALARDRLPAA